MYMCVYLYNNGNWKELKHWKNSLKLNLYFERYSDHEKGNIIHDIEKKGWDIHLAREGKQAVFVSLFIASCHFRVRRVRQQQN